MTDPLLYARALVLHDLAACGDDSPHLVDLVEDIITERRWWIEEWPEGADYVAGQVAQDVQDRMLDSGLRWPRCPRHPQAAEEHDLHIEPDLGPDAHWVCSVDAVALAPLGALRITINDSHG